MELNRDFAFSKAGALLMNVHRSAVWAIALLICHLCRRILHLRKLIEGCCFSELILDFLRACDQSKVL